MAPVSVSLSGGMFRVQLQSQLNQTKSGRPVQSRPTEKASSCSACVALNSAFSRSALTPSDWMRCTSHVERQKSKQCSSIGSSRHADSRGSWNFVKNSKPSQPALRKRRSASTAHSESTMQCNGTAVEVEMVDTVGRDLRTHVCIIAQFYL